MVGPMNISNNLIEWRHELINPYLFGPRAIGVYAYKSVIAATVRLGFIGQIKDNIGWAIEENEDG